MEDAIMRAVAIVGIGSILPDAPDVKSFWSNISTGRYSVSDVPPGRWDPALYYDTDRTAPDKTYSKIGGWVQQADWNPVGWRLPIPPRVAEAMDEAQRWGIACAVQALADYGYPSRPLNPERTAVILGNAMAGEKHYVTAMRVSFPEYAGLLETSPSFSSLPPAVRRTITREWHERLMRALPEITEDSMPGELANCIAGRIANLMNFRGPNFVVDAACASAMAAIRAAAEGLANHEFDAAVTGGIDRNMSAHTFVKFCKIGALSATGSRPYADGADGFVMGEGAVLFLLKRLADAEAAGDRIYAVIRGVGASSDGKGKGITAPNPVGQRLAIERAWRNADLPPESVTMVEGHGTSTAVGDVVEVQSLADVFGPVAPRKGAVALGSVKSNIGHLKGAAGAAGLLKTALALHHKQVPPNANFERPNPNIAFDDGPFTVPTQAQPWEVEEGATRRAGVSAFGFGGTNFHVVLEEFVPGRLTAKGKSQVGASAETPLAAPEVGPPRRGGQTATDSAAPATPALGPPSLAPLGEEAQPLRGCLVVGAQSPREIIDRLRKIESEARKDGAALPARPAAADLAAPERIAIDYGRPAELADKCLRAIKALEADAAPMWKALRAQGIFRGRGPKAKVAFLYTGQGSQYVNMLRGLRDREPVVRATFEEADRITTPLLGKPVTQFLFADAASAEAMAAAEESLRQTAITQPAVLTVDTALTRLLATFGVVPDMVMGHSLGEYGALHAAGALPLADALEAVSARGREMTKVSVADNGRMAAVFAPMAEVERLLRQVDGYVVVANINSTSQAVIGGATGAVTRAIEIFRAAGFQVTPLSVSHAFHTSIVAPATAPLRMVLERLDLKPAAIPVVSNVTGDFYPMGPDARPAMLDLLGRQVASPVQFVKGLETLFAAGARVFIEVGPKKALHGFAEEAFGQRQDVSCIFTNHPKLDDVVAFNQALCGLYAAGLGTPAADKDTTVSPLPEDLLMNEVRVTATVFHDKHGDAPTAVDGRYAEIGKRLAPVIEQCLELFGQARPAPTEPVVVSGAALGLPGSTRVFDDGNIGRLLRGERLIGAIPDGVRRAMAEKRITRLVKSEAGEPRFDVIEDPADVIKLAARAGALDMGAEFGIAEDRLAALDHVTRLAIGAGLDALRDAGIPLVLRYKTTTRGTQLPDRWGLPEALRDETGIIFGSAFPGIDSLVGEVTRYHVDRGRREKIEMLQSLRSMMNGNVDDKVRAALDARMQELQEGLDRDPYLFDRRFLLRTLAMGHSQFAELIGARGPNTQVNAACATTTHAMSLAEDWIRQGRCRRVIVITADDVTTDNLLEWFGAGFLASGAAATDERVEDAVLPFDRRRHGLVVGMGAAGVVVESAAALRERGVQPICQVMATVSANSAFHGTRLDVQHIAGVMEQVVSEAERRWQLDRREIAGRMVFVSHETYTPARGGSASAEATALRRVFGDHADRIVIANTKGYTGHPMAAGIEDVAAIKILETGIVPAVANHQEFDPDLGPLNLSRGGEYPVEFALRLGAGFGSQIAMSLMRWVPTATGQRRSPDALGYGYRVTDSDAWRAWLKTIATGESNDVEVVSRTLRVKASRMPKAIAAPAPAANATPAPAAIAAPAPAANATPPVDWEGTLAGVAPHHRPEVAPAVPQPSAGTEAGPTESQPQPVTGITTPPSAPPAGTDAGPSAAAVAPTADAVTPTPVGRGFSLAAAVTEDDIKKAVLALVVEKTGYPEEMLDLDLDLEADLGVDTVKQAELMASIRGQYGIPRDDKLKLRDFPTLAHVIRFVHDRLPKPAGTEAGPTTSQPQPVAGITTPPSAPPAGTEAGPTASQPQQPVTGITAPPPASPAGTDAGPTPAQTQPVADPAISQGENRPAAVVVAAASVSTAEGAPHDPSPVVDPPERPRWVTPHVFEEANLVPRRIPTPVLRPPLAMCKRTGVNLQAGKRVVVMCDESGAGSLLITHLRDLGVQCLLIGGAPSAVELGARIHGWLSGGPIHGVFWLPALDPEGEWRQLTPEMWHEATYRRVKLLGVTMRALYEQVSRPGTFLVAGTRMGGHHGYDPGGAASPLGGAVSGFVKAYKRERPDALVKVVDFAEDTPVETVAARLLDETQHDPACVEIGYRLGERWTITLTESDGPGAVRPIVLDKKTVFVVTGAAGSIVSAIIGDLAAASGGTFYLLDKVDRPDPSNPDLMRLVADREGLKRELLQRARSAGERVTPAMIERELAGIERQQAALAAIQSVESVGGRAVYLQVDLTDARAVAGAIDTVRAGSGHIDVLLHAAGIEISRSLCNKAQPEFDLIFDVKATGFFNLLHAIGDMPLGASVAFSSVAGRFGNAGQTDYSAANDLLCKAASNFRRSRPGTRGIAIDWTAWRDIGMASRGSVPMLLEQAGIEMIPPDAGIPIIRQHLVEGWTSGEVVVAGRLGMMMAEADVTGGVDVEALLRKRPNARGPMIGRIVSMSVHGGLVVETGLDPAVQPFLSDHRIDGVAVLPGAMGIEAFGELASLVLPEWQVASVEDVRFLAPFKFYKGAPRTLVLRAMFRADGDSILADCRLLGHRTLPGHSTDQETTHFTGVVRMQRHVGQPERVRVPRTDAVVRVEAPDIYRIYFHGPAYRVLDSACRVHRMAIGRMTRALPANHVPADLPTVMAPRLIELAFQAAGIWDLGVNGHLSLPHAIDRVARYGGVERPNGSLVAIVHPDPCGNVFDADVVDEAGAVYLSIRGYRIVELPGAPDATLLRPLRDAMQVEALPAPARVPDTVPADAHAAVVAVGAQATDRAAVLVHAH